MVADDIVQEMILHLRQTLDYEQSITDEQLLEHIESTVFHFSSHYTLTSRKMKWLVYRIFHAFRGLDVLQPLIDDPTITEIMINNAKEIFIEQNGEIFASSVQFESVDKLEDIIQMIVAKVNRVVNEASPIVDARLEDGSRVHVVLPPIALNGPALTIRKFPEKPLLIDDLIRNHSLTHEVAQFLECVVKAKYNIFIGGGTGSGKTTFLNALSNFIPKHERVITIEDSAELQLVNIPNVVRLETRNANTEGKGEITMRDLIKASLRMRPNRIIVGEVRGAEALDMLQAMNTGHDGALSTGHANSVQDMLSRLETMVLSGSSLPVQVVRQQISSAIDIMVHLARLRDHSRRVVEVSEVLDVKDGDIELNRLYEFEEGHLDDGRGVQGQLRSTGQHVLNTYKLKQAGVELHGLFNL